MSMHKMTSKCTLSLFLTQFCFFIVIANGAQTSLQRCFGAQVNAMALDTAQFNDNFGTSVKSVSALDCDFSSSCCWGDLQLGTINWYHAEPRERGRVSAAAVKKCFGTREVPSGSFSVAYSAHAGPTGKAVLASCQMECTETGTVEVSLKHWRADNAVLEVCSVHTYTGAILSCRAITGANPGPSTAVLDAPKCDECFGRSPFDIYIVARNIIVHNKGGAVAIDSVKVTGGALGVC